MIRYVFDDVHRVTQHFFDVLGRKINTTTRIASTPGDAVEPDFVSPAGSWSSTETTEYPRGVSDYVVHTDARGLRTITYTSPYYDRIETTTETYSPTNYEACVTRTLSTQYHNGSSISEAQWDGLWTRSTRSTTYDEDGTRIETSITESIGDELVTNRVVRFEFLERVVSEETPKGTNSTEYVGSTSRVASSTFQNEETQQIATYGYDIHGDLSSTAQNGVTLRDVTTYETINNEIWRIDTQTRTSDISTRVASSRTQLTGLSNALRGHTVSTNYNGEVTVSQSSWDQARQTTTDTITSNLRSSSSQTRQFGRVISSHTPDEERRLYFDPFGRAHYTERKENSTSTWHSVEKNVCNTRGEVLQSETFLNDIDTASTIRILDAFGQVVKLKDALENVISYSYDSRGRTTSVAGAAYPTRYQYDTAGRLTGLSTTRDGETWDTTTWTYDSTTGHLLSKTYSDGSVVHYTRRLNGKPIRTTTARGVWKENEYNAKDELTSVEYAGNTPTDSFAYDADGNTISANNIIATQLLVYSGNIL